LKLKTPMIVCAVLGAGAVGLAAARLPILRMGKQPNGDFIVATGQRIIPGTVAFDGRPIDLALHPNGEWVAVLNQKNVLLMDDKGVFENGVAALPNQSSAAYRGIVCSLRGGDKQPRSVR
jgi:hypothetical protein